VRSGTVKFYNSEKGYGFVRPDDGGEDIFVHVSKLRAASIESLRSGQRVDFEAGIFKGRAQVDSIRERNEPDVIAQDSKAGKSRNRSDSDYSSDFRAVREYKERSERGSFSSKSDFERSYDRMWRSIRDSK
jgi:CspA family cold shock protein